MINLVEALPKDQTTSQVIGKQLLRSGTSVGANYRAACRAKSTAELITKLNITLEEADESLYWMELIVKAKLVDSNKLQSLMQEELRNCINAGVLPQNLTVKTQRFSDL
ncbi:four helix bundle protein [Halotia wernerae UHCC 0503]|nr:four helix bundle protein [Halotia wernerae UHCC 0503]